MYARTQAALLLTLLTLGIPGCASHSYGPPGPRSVTADWNDVDAAVRVGVKHAEMAILTSCRPQPDLVIFQLRTVGDEPATLEVRATDPQLSGPQTLTLIPAVGRFGNPKQEARLASSVQRRLQQLAGVEHAADK